MKQKAIQFSSILAGIAFLAVFFSTAIQNTPATNAISAMDFKAGNIIDDGVFYNKNTMTVEEIQAHLNRYMPACDTWGTGAVGSGRYINGKAVPANTTRAEYARQMRAAGKTRYHEPPYVCVQNYYENPTTHETLYETKNVIKEGMISAAQIIYNAAQQYGINPQVLLVMLRKESYVWGDNWPLKDEYNTVMGYACPDNAPCNEKYFGFYNQVMTAAWQLNYYKEHIYSYNYRPYAKNYILYSPTASCGRKEVYLENLATTSLYIYTPYTPNDAALRNYPGTATCGSYGNRNFFMYFSEWFGSTHSFNISKRMIPEMDYHISNSDASKLVYVTDNSKESGAKMLAGEKNDISSTFSFKRNSDNSYTITNKNSGLVLAIPDTGAILDAKVQQVSNTGTTTQKWFVYTDGNGGYYLASAASAAYVLAIKDDGAVALDIYGSQSSKPIKLSPVVTDKIAEGDYVIESSLKKDLVLDMTGNWVDEGINITTYGANNTAAQVFKISFDEKSGFYSLQASHNKLITAKSKPVSDGVNIQTNKDTTECTQRFLIYKNTDDDSYTIASACDLSFAIDVYAASTKNSANVDLWSQNSTKAQRWVLIPKKQEAVVTEKPSEQEPTTPETPIAPQTPETPKQLIENGNYVIHSVLRSNYVIDVYAASTANGANIQLWDKNNTVAQTFNVKYNAERDAYMLISPYSNHAIDLYGAVTKNGRNIHSWSANETCAQYWKITKNTNNTYMISSSCNSNFVLDVVGAGTKRGTNLNLYSRNGTKAQEWTFEKK